MYFNLKMKTHSKLFKAFQLFVMSIVLFVIIVTSIRSSFNGYYSFYYENKEYQKPTLFKISDIIASNSVFRFFSVYSGFDTGYGFFAPNVSSDFIFMFRAYDHENNLIQIQQGVPFQSKESEIRFGCIGGMYLEKLNDKDHKNYDEKYNRYLDVIIHEISDYLKNQNSLICKMESLFI